MAEVEYYSGRSLVVSSAKLTYKGATYPISAVTSVSIEQLPEEETDGMAGSVWRGAGLIVVGLLLTGFLFLEWGLAALSEMTVWVAAGAIMVLAGLWMLVRGWRLLGVLQQMRDVRIQLASGGEFAVRTASSTAARDVKQAIDRAITVRETASTQPSSVAEELSKLAELRDAGVVTAQDWERAKDLFLGKPSDQQAEAITRLRKLHELYRDGVLSESEFNMKKWDVLSRTD